jgi:hypothetical protein
MVRRGAIERETTTTHNHEAKAFLWTGRTKRRPTTRPRKKNKAKEREETIA